MTVPPSTFGIPALRTEDPRFLRGEGRYLENVDVPGSLRAVFVRSIFPHADLKGVQGLEDARAMPGVVAVYTADDLGIPAQPPSGNVEAPGGSLDAPFEREVLARDRLRYAGEPFAVVIAETRAQGVDAAEVIWADAELLEPVNDAERAAADGAPLLWPAIGTNVAHRFEHAWDEDVLAGADVVVRGRFVNQRLAPVPMEANGIAVVPTEAGYDVWVSTQIPFDVRDDLAELLGVERDRVHTIAPDVGGGFGAKVLVYPEYLVVARAAQLLRRPVRWFETRSESMLSLWHGRGQVQHVEIGARRDGTLVGLRVDIVADMGAYPLAAFLPTTTGEMLAGVYRIPKVAYRGRAIVTNATPIGAYRGAGRPEAAACIERAVDMVATELGLDPVEVRRRNLIPPDAFPYTTRRRRDLRQRRTTGPRSTRRSGWPPTTICASSSGNVDVATITCCWGSACRPTWRSRPSPRRSSHRSMWRPTGRSPSTQGRRRTARATRPRSRSWPRARSACRSRRSPWSIRIPRASNAARERGGRARCRRAAPRSRPGPGEVLDRARCARRGAARGRRRRPRGPAGRRLPSRPAPPTARVTWAELAAAATERDLPLTAKGVYREPGSTFPFGAHVAVVQVDRETGEVDLLRHVAVDDCGRILNPMLVRGQQHGGIAQGIAQALFEEVVFDEVGNPMTSTLATYLMPSAADLPRLEASNTETPTAVNPLGAKGIGESGSIGATPAIQNAVVDALSHLGVRHVDLPCSPERVWQALRAAERAPSDVR